jgi:hypothetical protein
MWRRLWNRRQETAAALERHTRPNDVPPDEETIDISTYATPEQAALAGFDPQFAHVIGVVRSYAVHGFEPDDDDHLEVELATNERPREYPYFVHVERDGDGRWREGVSHA